MHRCIVGLATLFLALTCTSALRAQADTSGPQPAAATKRLAVCWYPKPESLCRSYMITEVHFEKPFSSTDGELGLRYGWTFGPMINRGSSDALGVLASFATGPYRSGPSRFEGRYRRWLGEKKGVDLTLGYARHNVAEGPGPDVWLRGVTAAAAFEYEVFAIESRVDRVRGGGRAETSTSVSLRAGSYAAPLTALAAYVGLLAWFMIDSDRFGR